LTLGFSHVPLKEDTILILSTYIQNLAMSSLVSELSFTYWSEAYLAWWSCLTSAANYLL